MKNMCMNGCCNTNTFNHVYCNKDQCKQSSKVVVILLTLNMIAWKTYGSAFTSLILAVLWFTTTVTVITAIGSNNLDKKLETFQLIFCRRYLSNCFHVLLILISKLFDCLLFIEINNFRIQQKSFITTLDAKKS